MRFDLEPEKLRALPVQIIEIADAVILKRGRTEIKIMGEQAAQAIKTVLQAASCGATREQMVSLFSTPEQALADALVQDLLNRRILVSEGDIDGVAPGEETNLDVFYWHFGLTASQAREGLNQQRIMILGVNYITRQLMTSLRASGANNVEVLDYPLLRNLDIFENNEGANLKPEEWPISLGIPSMLRGGTVDLDPGSIDCIVATSDLGFAEPLRECNEFSVLHRIPFLPVVLQQLVGYIGPLTVPGETACFECLRSRQNTHFVDYYSHRAAEAGLLYGRTVAGFHPSMASILGDIAGLELTKYFGIGRSLVKVGALIEVNLLGCEMRSHFVLKVPRCEVCSSLRRTVPAPLTKIALRTGDRR